MVWIAGADGCKSGWFRVSWETGTSKLRFHLIKQAQDLLKTPPQPKVLALNIPIGLTEKGQRDCDKQARQLLGWPRRTSVFPAPIRPALEAKNRIDASERTQAIDGRRVNVQTWAIFPKICEVDKFLQSNLEARKRVHEVHPEVSFYAWAKGPMKASKKKRAGKLERRELVDGWLVPDAFDSARKEVPLKKHVSDDDILDAIAALWTANRINDGNNETLPPKPQTDAKGLRMKIVY